MKQLLFLIGLFSLLINCSSKQDAICNAKPIVPFAPTITDTLLYLKDKQQIKDCYIANVEYYRLNPDKIDKGNLFDPWGCYYSEKDGYVKLPTPTEQNIEVYIDDVFYNPNKLMAVIFLANKQDYKQKGIEKSLPGREFTSMCFIGLRKTIDESFVLYPLRLFEQIGYPNYEEPLKIIKAKYFNCLAKSSPGWNKTYRTNLGDKNFWTNNLLFDTVTTDDSFKYHTSDFAGGEKLYHFQTYSVSNMDGEHWDNHYKYDVIDCNKK